MDSISCISGRIDFLMDSVEKEERAVKLLLIGRKAKILSKFNDQQYGSSRKSLTGKVYSIKSIFYDEGNYLVKFDECDCYIHLDELEII